MQSVLSRSRARAFFLGLYLFLLTIPPYVVLVGSGGFDPFWKLLFDEASATYLLLRIFGLYGFIFLFVQIMLGAFMTFWINLYGARIFVFHAKHGLFAYLFILFHPTFYVLNWVITTGVFDPVFLLLPNFSNLRQYYISLGKIGFTLFTLAVLGAYFRHKAFLNLKWRPLHLLNYVVFFLIFVHASKIGTDTRTWPITLVFPFMAILVAVAFFYRLAYLPFLERRAKLAFRKLAAKKEDLLRTFS